MRTIIEFFRLFLWAHALRKKSSKKRKRRCQATKKWTLFNRSRSHSQDSRPVFM